MAHVFHRVAMTWLGVCIPLFYVAHNVVNVFICQFSGNKVNAFFVQYFFFKIQVVIELFWFILSFAPCLVIDFMSVLLFSAYASCSGS